MTEKKIFLPPIGYGYVALVLVALLYFAAFASESPMAGIYAMLLTLPWSMALIQLLTTIHPSLFESVWTGPAVVLLSAVVNVAIIHFIARKRHSKSRRNDA